MPIIARRITQLLIGLNLFGVGIALMLEAHLGVAPWDVLSQGISKQTGLEFGVVTVALSVVVLLGWIPLRERIGWGTIANTIIIGPSAQFFLWLFPTPTELWWQFTYLVAGIVIISIGSGLYIGARFGPGPRDGLMTGLVRVTGRPVWLIRGSIEITVLAIGWALGGVVGIGTVLFAFGIGPLVNYTLPLFDTSKLSAQPIDELADDGDALDSAAPLGQ